MFEFRDYMGNEYIQGFLQGAARKGLDPHAILQKAGIPPEAYDDPEARISGTQLYSLTRTIKEELNDIYLGFLEYPAKMAMDNEVVEKATRCGTLGESLKATNQFLENYRNDIDYGYTLDKKTHEFCLGLNYKILPNLDGHILHFYRLTNVHRFFCWLTGSRIKLTRVCFPEPQPEYCFDYHKIFHCEVEFDQPECQLCFDNKYLRSPVVRKASEFHGVIKDHDWFSIPGHESSLTSQIEQILLEQQKKNCFSPPIGVIADALAMNPRTIRRALARENESYQKIKSRLRRDLAIKLLLTTETPVSIIAGKLGFAEPGDFTRAFSNWTKTTPSAYRAAHAWDDTQTQQSGVA